LIASGPDPRQNFWIKEISRSRTEIKAARQDLSNFELSTAFNEFNGILGTDAYYPDFVLDFGLDIQIIAVNAVYVEEEGKAMLYLNFTNHYLQFTILNLLSGQYSK